MAAKLKQIGLFAASLVFVASGIFLYLYGDPEDRVMALAATAFFTACLLVFAYQLFVRPTPLATDASGAIIVPSSRTQNVLFAIGAGLMAGAGPFISQLAAQEHKWGATVAGWVALPFFGACALLSLMGAVKGGPIYRLDSQGIESLAPGKRWSLPWRAVTEIKSYAYKGSRYLTLVTPSLATGSRSVGAQGSNAAFEDLAEHVYRLWSENRA